MNGIKFANAFEKSNESCDTESVARRHKKRGGWLKRIVLAVCLALVLLVIILVAAPQQEIPLSSRSVGVTVRLAKIPFYFGSGSGDLIYLSEKELMTKTNTAIFKGTVTAINNVVVNFKGTREYRAIAEIEVEKVYRGECVENETVTVLLPYPIAYCIGTGDTEVTMEIKVGITGIFMPMKYDAVSEWKENGATLILKDIADYGFADGERYAFLETGDGLIFDKTVYKGVGDATALDEIEDYIQKITGDFSL